MSDLQPGREMDAMVAVEIHGWKLGNINRGDYGWWVPDATRRSGKRLQQYLPAFSTSISAAWEVVEKMCEMGWHYSVESFHTGVGVCFGRAGDDDDGVLWVQHDANGSTAPHAIALAALKAVGAIP